MHLEEIRIQRFRSINNLVVKIKNNEPLIICGSNNVGKTNFLRALDLFFSLNKAKFNKDVDIPYDIAVGRSSGGRYITTFNAVFSDGVCRYAIKVDYKWHKKIGNQLEISGKKDGQKMLLKDARKIIKEFRFIFVEASNVNLPRLIDEIIDDEVLPIGLDSLRARQTEPLKIFKKFIKKSEESVKKIEKEVSRNLDQFIVDVPGINAKGWRIEILFSEYNKLREAISGMINLTLYDKSRRKMESKGSGIQRMVFLSLLKYIANHSSRKIIWGIDEPEAFLQPALQKKIFKILLEISQKQAVYYTSHSPALIDINNVSNTCLFEAEYEERAFAKAKKEVFYKVKTFIDTNCSEQEKIHKIREHLGVARNDGWEVMPYNLLVEGEEDKYYLLELFHKFGINAPNMFVAGGTGKIKGYLQFLQEFCGDCGFKPKIRCLIDHDTAGKNEMQSLSAKTYAAFDFKLEFVSRCDGLKTRDYDYEIEDFIYPEIICDPGFNNEVQHLEQNQYSRCYGNKLQTALLPGARSDCHSSC